MERCADRNEALVALSAVENDIFCELPEADGAKLERPAVVLVDVHESVHKALIVHAVSDSKHVTDFVDHHAKRRIKDHLPVYFLLLS